jgi:hypothetical protein
MASSSNVLKEYAHIQSVCILPYKDPFFCFGARAIVHPFWMSVKFHTFYLFINITKNYTLGGGQTNLSLFELLLSVRGVVATEV